MKRSIYHIAKEANVSVATVSRVLNNKPDVSEATRQKILELIHNGRFEPRVVKNKADTLGVIYHWIAHSFGNYYVFDILSGIVDAAASFGFNVLLIPDMPRDIRDLGTYLKQRHVQGVIHIAPMSDDVWLSRIGVARIPQIVVGGRCDRYNISYVDSDNVDGAREAVRYLLNFGHRRIGFIGGQMQQSNHVDRLTGYRAALHDAGIQCDERLIFLIDDESAWVSGEGGKQGALYLLSQPTPPTAIFVASGHCIMGALSAINDLGLKVPDDVSIVGYDDIPLASYTVPPLTTVRQPIYELGKKGAEELLCLIDDTSGNRDVEPKRIVLHAPLIIRQSVKPIS
ncbi:MAG: LacI family DNA-binding transcriptional regulator [Firmicutes bacterium]|nr:LacI family DNA-binding transcriptional regulator [Bacillota bacterium]